MQRWSKRDRAILGFFDRFYCATIDHVHRLFCPAQKYGYQIAARRLRALKAARELKCMDRGFGHTKIYYRGPKKKSWQHWLELTDLYVTLCELARENGHSCDLEPEVLVEYPRGSIIPDAVGEYRYPDATVRFVVEILRDGQLRGKDDEYTKWRSCMREGVFPRILLLAPAGRLKRIMIKNPYGLHYVLGALEHKRTALQEVIAWERPTSIR